MRVLPRRKALALLVAASAVVPSCTLLNPLEHLQAGFDQDDGSSGRDDGGGTSGLDGDTRDAVVDLPGCEREGWTACGVTVTARAEKLGGAVFVALGSTVSLYFTDERAGTISVASCTPSRCDTPRVSISGESAPRTIGLAGGTLAWVTPGAVRRISIAPPTDGGPETVGTPAGNAELTANYPQVAWTDDTGMYAVHQSVSSAKKLGGGPARSPVVTRSFSWIANGMVQHNAWDGVTNVPSSTTFPGTEGAELVAAAPLYGYAFEAREGLVASLRRDGGTDVVVADLRDDAGAPVVLTRERDPVRALASTGTYVYWTTSTGYLRRQAKDVPEVVTVLNGLGEDTALTVSIAGLVAVVDRTHGEILTYAPP
jgi:hypothetical protein